MADDRLANLMKLGLTEEEALETLADDDEVDKMKDKEVNNDLTEEQKKVVKKAKNIGTRTTNYQLTKRERKPNEIKQNLITALAEWCKTQEYENVRISNKEKFVDFTINGTEFSLSLIQHRPPKK